MNIYTLCIYSESGREQEVGLVNSGMGEIFWTVGAEEAASYCTSTATRTVRDTVTDQPSDQALDQASLLAKACFSFWQKSTLDLVPRACVSLVPSSLLSCGDPGTSRTSAASPLWLENSSNGTGSFPPCVYRGTGQAPWYGQVQGKVREQPCDRPWRQSINERRARSRGSHRSQAKDPSTRSSVRGQQQIEYGDVSKPLDK